MMKFNYQLLVNQMPGCVAWKDLQLKYCGANQNLLQQLQFPSVTALIGLDDNELAINSEEDISLFKQQDLQTLQGHSLEIIHTLETPTNKTTYLLQKTPLTNEKNSIIGLIYHCSTWSQPELISVLNKLDRKYQPSEVVQKNYRIDENHNPLQLSRRELECLFLLLRGQTAQQTATVLQLSRRTIESYLENLKNKFACLNKSELLVKALSLGYQNHLPKSLLAKNLHEIFK